MFDTLLGKNYLIKIFAGKYNRPFEEDRIFMFLDLKSSTSIAEKLGHKRFLSLLNDFFYDLAEPVVATKGQIYKYVGDEAIVTWKIKRAKVSGDPIGCFFQLKKQISKKSSGYLEKYGLIPEFKAGMHGGIVVTGEMGFIKKEIAYLGDVLNTTARIESACNEFGAELIVSDTVLSRLNLGGVYKITHLGSIKFRGKENAVEVAAVEEVNGT